ncbi:glycoside hydrolase family 3 protein [Companilactobacillus mishanensis]|uniref:glycoside hydrolase family 3 protein n=1 Tax=Companilactobacillus mishanensis TaxID=2486008 RepID=UPI001295E749|nr:glycoside hydrolase family 3 protein [Companilactobacillus mishanensis]MQS89774.1 glycoside hydrolase [Companilactobacillus mishanensis]
MNRKQKRILLLLIGAISVFFISFFTYLGNASAATTSDSDVSETSSQTSSNGANDGAVTNASATTDVNANTTANSDESATTSPDPNETEIANSQLSTSAAEDGMVLLQNNNGTLPISTDDSVALFGGGAYGTVKGGTGSGNVNPRKTVNIWDGLKDAGYQIKTDDYLTGIAKDYDTQNAAFAKSHPMMGTFNYADPQISQATFDSAPADVGIYVLSRNAGEGADRTDTKGDYEITNAELNNIKNVAKKYNKSILLLNVGGQVDTKFIDQIPDLDSVLLVSQGGQNTGVAVADLLSGKVTPSGKLVDTWANNYSDYPASATFGANDGNTEKENYTEGIYVGYRYFDTYNVTPHYEFGYGLSYTDFKVATNSVSVYGTNLVTKVTVTNVGNKYSGREVVQEYYSAPKGTVDKAFQNLAAYAKTDVLAPGQSETLTMSFPIYNMASYDTATSSYIMDAGNYIVRVGDSSRNTDVAAVLNLPNKVTTEKLSSEMAPAVDPTVLHGSDNTYVPANQAAELASAPVINLDSSSLNMVRGNNASTIDENAVTTIVNKNSTPKLPTTDLDQTIVSINAANGSSLKDVYSGKITMDQFIASLSTKQLSQIVSGNLVMTAKQLASTYNMMKNGMDSVSSVDSSDPDTASALSIIGSASTQVPGAAGQTTSELKNRGIPVSVNSDGPAGLRLTPESKVNGQTRYQYATAWPIGTLLAQAWDPQMMYKVGDAVGKEMKEFGVDTWLAPGMNIHRDPLNGRNFEYYSEDPLVAGVSATAITKGVQTNPGVGTTVKHFFANSQESSRQTMDAEIGEQAMREIYLKGFETVMKDAQPEYVMSSYNQVNGQYNAANFDLLTNILRGEWGYKGTVMTDWYNLKSLSDPASMMRAGNDLIMPGGTQQALQIAATNAADGNKLALGDLQKSAESVLNTIMKTYTFAQANNLTAKSITPYDVDSIMTANGASW